LSKTSLECILFNSRSIVNKLTDLHKILSDYSFDIIFITESWTNDSIPNSMIVLNFDYGILRLDRKVQKGGGVLILFRKTICISEVAIPEHLSNTESIVCDLSLNSYKMRFLLTYRSPSCDENHLNVLKDIFTLVYNSSVQSVFVGDFNFPLIKWDNPPIFELSLDFWFFTHVSDFGLI